MSDPQGYYNGGFGLGLSARDLAKIGFLYLNNGYWDGQSIVSEYWVKESTDQQIQAFRHPIYGTFGYGYQWWVKEVDGFNSFRAWGRRGQFLVIVPQLDLVIAVTSETAMPHPPTSIHYNPLFDLVATSVKRNRPPKKPLKAVELPTDVNAFVTDYNQATFNKSMATIADLISDRFLHDGVTKQMALRFLKRNLSYTSEAKIIITKFEPEGDEAKIDVWLKDKYFEVPFMTDSKLIKETEHWKWYGNQVPK
jgi:CubicO group peptidase (beta-lactamase class C family)